MAAIVYQTNKKTGITYVYESTSYWDKKKQQSRAKRKCIGKLDPETKAIIPTRKRKKPVVMEKAKRGSVPFTKIARRFYRATYLLDRIGEETGITEDLKCCFPDTYRQILSIAYYLILEDRKPLSRFPAGRFCTGIPMAVSLLPSAAEKSLLPSRSLPGNCSSACSGSDV